MKPITAQMKQKMPHSQPMQGMKLSSPASQMTRAWFRWNLAPSRSPSTKAITRPIQVR